MDIGAKEITIDREGRYKRANLPKRHSNPECACTKQQSSQLLEENPGRSERKDR